MQKKRMTLDELRKVQLSILVAVAEVCEKSDIKYWLDSGTLLGAIRHKGYIPWDDDIDIGMLREDYDSFIKQFNELSTNNRYQVHCIENDENFYLPIAKVYDTHTLLYEPDENGFRSCVNIDVFVYDNAPDDDNLVRAIYDKRDKLRRCFDIQNQRRIHENNPIIKTAKLIRRYIYTTFIPKATIEEMVENAKCYANIQTRRIGNFTGYVRFTCDRARLDEIIQVSFEGIMFNAPKEYDYWLRLLYGDYMQLPPEEKRVSHHGFIAYKME